MKKLDPEQFSQQNVCRGEVQWFPSRMVTVAEWWNYGPDNIFHHRQIFTCLHSLHYQQNDQRDKETKFDTRVKLLLFKFNSSHLLHNVTKMPAFIRNWEIVVLLKMRWHSGMEFKSCKFYLQIVNIRSILVILTKHI